MNLRRKVGRLAERTATQVAERVRDDGRGYTVTKFGRHPDGYFHARVTPAGGKAIYVYCKYGSWMAPTDMDATDTAQEHREVLPEVAADLAARARTIVKAERRERGKDGQDQDSSQDGATDDPDGSAAG